MSNASLISHLLTSAGLTRAAALAMLGNWQAESGLEPNRLQGDFSRDRALSRQYTEDVMSGRISRTQFSRDQKGYGLAQWTYFNFQTGQGRKQALYDYWKVAAAASPNKTVPLDDITLQVSFALHELKSEPQYAALWSILRTTDDLSQATDKICRLFEQPYYNNVSERYRYAIAIAEQLRENSSSTNAVVENTASAPTPAKGCFWPPRTVDLTMSGDDVLILQAVLRTRGYSVPELSGTFDESLASAVRLFQQEKGLTVDGIVGQQTWSALLSLK